MQMEWEYCEMAAWGGGELKGGEGEEEKII